MTTKTISWKDLNSLVKDTSTHFSEDEIRILKNDSNTIRINSPVIKRNYFRKRISSLNDVKVIQDNVFINLNQLNEDFISSFDGLYNFAGITDSTKKIKEFNSEKCFQFKFNCNEDGSFKTKFYLQDNIKATRSKIDMSWEELESLSNETYEGIKMGMIFTVEMVKSSIEEENWNLRFLIDALIIIYDKEVESNIEFKKNEPSVIQDIMDGKVRIDEFL